MLQQAIEHGGVLFLGKPHRNRAGNYFAYSVAIFGSPGAGPWGWKLEGHHLSLNFTGKGEATAVTPAFLGANPAEVRQGPRAGVRVLAAEEDLARELLASLTPEQRKEAIIGDTAPADILAAPGRGLDDIAATGLPVSSMDAAQRTLVNRLLSEFAGNLKHDLRLNVTEILPAFFRNQC